MTIHVISVGVSLLDGFLTTPWAYVRQRAELGSLADAIASHTPGMLLARNAGDDSAAASAWLARCLGAEEAPGGAHPREHTELAALTRAVTPAQWPAEVSPELDTFARASGAHHLLSRDVAVLIATDTTAGLTAALWNAVALAADDLTRVRYLAEPGALPAPNPRGGVLIVRVGGLDARNEQDFRTAMRGLGSLGRNLLEHVAETHEPFRFYLSGGFKAAIPYLIGLAEGLRSLPAVGPVDALVLHETTKSGAIRLPLRRMTPDLIRAELSDFDPEGRRQTKPRGAFLEGYAYERDGEHWRLTAFGEGLRVLVGLASEGIGG